MSLHNLTEFNALKSDVTGQRNKILRSVGLWKGLFYLSF